MGRIITNLLSNLLGLVSGLFLGMIGISAVYIASPETRDMLVEVGDAFCAVNGPMP